MAKNQQLRKLQTRKKILANARYLFDKFGYEETSVDTICQQSGVAKGTVFAHFSDKASLLTAVRIEQLEAIAILMQENYSTRPAKDPVQAIVTILKPWLDLFANDPSFTKVFMDQASLKGGEWALRLYETCLAMETALTHIVNNLLAEEFLDPKTSANIYVQGINAFFYHVLTGLQSGATRNSKDQEILLRGLLTRWLQAEGR